MTRAAASMLPALVLALAAAAAASPLASAFTSAPLLRSNLSPTSSSFSSFPSGTSSASTGAPPAPLLLASAGRDSGMTEEEREIALERATRAMTAFSNKYVANTDTRYCHDMSIPAVVIRGLAEHKVSLGAPLCPCRYYEDKEREAKDGFWNCPCVPMRERHECHCMLFLTEDNDFAGDETEITYDEVVDLSGGATM